MVKGFDFFSSGTLDTVFLWILCGIDPSYMLGACAGAVLHARICLHHGVSMCYYNMAGHFVLAHRDHSQFASTFFL